uniref:Uncharacterized protein n=1 Tax=Panagrolaimus davidi TaxID=227884 RepID=A0A914PQU0_9BILA
MLHKVDFVQTAVLSADSTVIKFAENYEFTVVYKPELSCFKIENAKGDFKIETVSLRRSGDNFECFTSVDKIYASKNRKSYVYSFYISANIEMKEICAVNYQLHIPIAHLQALKLFEFLKYEILLPEYNGLKFTYYIKKINTSSVEDIEMHIENPYDVEIQVK